jgi:blue copper oxidase
MKKFYFFLSGLLMAATGFAQQPNPLQIPDTLSGFSFALQLGQDSTQFLSGSKTKTYGINQAYLAPTLMLRRGDFVQMHVTNALADTTTMHWHGLHVAAADDGGPHTPIAPGATWSPDFTVLDEASTYWYHPHLHEHTAEQVYNGAAGMIIVHDSLEQALGLPHTYGVDDFPMIIQDKSFDSLSNQLIYEAISDTMMINGTLNPFLVVPAQMVRFRYLNASNQRVYNLGFPANISFMIASDGGLLEQPLPVTRILLAPGERVEIVVDFSGLSNSLPLISFNSEMGQGISGGPQGPGGGPGNPLDGVDSRICEFRVGPQTPNPVTSLPTNLRTYDVPPVQDAARTRVKDFDVHSSGFPFYINGLVYDMGYVNDTMQLGDIEIWEIHNNTDVAHPLHIHDVQFHVIAFNGPFVPGHLRGRKDVLLMQPGDTISFVTRFEDFADEHTPYMYHCHNLFHEDGGMMAQFIVADTVLSSHEDSPEAGFGSQLRFFPNPTHDFLGFEDDNIDPERVTSIEVVDMQGRLQFSQAIDPSRSGYRLDMRGLAPGMYLLHMRHKVGGQTFGRAIKL